MLKEILSISGKPGLYKMISQAKNMIIVESITDGKRIPAYAKDKIVSLGDIAIYTYTEEIPLAEVMENIRLKENGEKCTIEPKADNDTLRNYMAEILPEYDEDRVYPSDMRKLFIWYNLLIENGINVFLETKEEEKTEASEE